MNPQVMNQNPLDARQAWETLDDFVREVAPELARSTEPRDEFIKRSEHHRDVQDFYLIQLAVDAGCRLATHDVRLCEKWPEDTVRVA